jgi:signal transduction histidine kinase|nr:histidine kinase dimerization/phospho-acceptor domain-containing protein [uncultured Flavobacterium sp.]
MDNKKEINSLNCYLSNPKYYKQIIELDSEMDAFIKTKKKLTSEINDLRKSLADLQIEKEDLSLQLLQQLKDLKRSEKTLKNDFHKGLEEIMFTISHKVRLPLTNILGLANLLTILGNSNEENLEFIALIKDSAKDLDKITKELSTFIFELDHKEEGHFIR